MYALYEKQLQGDCHRYCFKTQISLFGCKQGYIPRLLKECLSSSACEPLPWHVNIGMAMKAIGSPNDSLVINLKPNNSRPNLSLYEVADVWGYSDYGWTPIMLYLRGLFVDAEPATINDQDFIRSSKEIDDPIFSMMYLTGTVKDGSIQGKWTPPGPSSTNSVLLWPNTFKYFTEKANEIMKIPA